MNHRAEPAATALLDLGVSAAGGRRARPQQHEGRNIVTEADDGRTQIVLAAEPLTPTVARHLIPPRAAWPGRTRVVAAGETVIGGIWTLCGATLEAVAIALVPVAPVAAAPLPLWPIALWPIALWPIPLWPIPLWPIPLWPIPLWPIPLWAT